MPRQFKLLAQHYIDDRLLEEGMIIGEGTEVPFTLPDGTLRPPSLDMEGLSPEAKAEVEAIHKAATWGANPIEHLPLTMAEEKPNGRNA